MNKIHAQSIINILLSMIYNEYDIHFSERLYVYWYLSIWQLLEINTCDIDSIEL